MNSNHILKNIILSASLFLVSSDYSFAGRLDFFREIIESISSRSTKTIDSTGFSILDHQISISTARIISLCSEVSDSYKIECEKNSEKIRKCLNEQFSVGMDNAKAEIYCFNQVAR